MDNAEAPPDHPVGKLSLSDIRYVPDLDAAIAALDERLTDDVAFRHSPGYSAATRPREMKRGVHSFGEARTTAADTAGYQHGVRGVTTAVLNNAYYSGNSLSILDSRYRLFQHGVEAIGDPTHLASYDPNFCLSVDRELCLKHRAVERAETINIVALPVCAVGAPNYAHFLIDGLSSAFMLSRLLPAGGFRVVGQGLRPRPGARTIPQDPGVHDAVAAPELPDGVRAAGN